MKSKVLLFDLETFPNIGYCWGKYEQTIIKYVREWELASFAYKWLGEPIHCFSRRDYSEKELTKKLWRLIDESDLVIAHYGDKFDIPKARTKFLQHGCDPNALNKSVDTKKVASNQFSFNSNSLGDLAEFFGFGKKLDTGGFDLWLQCMADDKTAWDSMMKYNKHDVLLLEKVYLKLRPWVPNHPNLSALQGAEGCPKCESENVQARGFTVTAKTKQQRYQCQDCGGWYTGRVSKGG